MVKISTMSSKKTHKKPVRAGNGRLKTFEPTVHGRTKDAASTSLACIPSVGQSRREKLPSANSLKKKRASLGLVMVPVLSSLGKPLMPCHPARARELIKQGRAVRRWYRGIFAIKLIDRSEGVIQQVVTGIDPGSKREAFTVKSQGRTYLNIMSDSVVWVSGRLYLRRCLRAFRRSRFTPCRKNKYNKRVNSKGLNPSFKSRWQIKLNIMKWLMRLYPISEVAVENIISKKRRGKSKFNFYFSQVEIGKNWFYEALKDIGLILHVIPAYYTKELRDKYGLKKGGNKKEERFRAHNVDSWTIANSILEGSSVVDNKVIFRIIPIPFHRRQLHRMQPEKKGIRKTYGGTISHGFKRGSVIRHKKWGLSYVGGAIRDRISLHSLKTGKRLCYNAKPKECNFLYMTKWRTYVV